MAEQRERKRQLVAELRAKIAQPDADRALAAIRRALRASGVTIVHMHQDPN